MSATWGVTLGIGGIAVTLLAVVLASYLAARNVAKLCMRREHREIAKRIDELEAFRDGHDSWAMAETKDLERRLDRLEYKRGWQRGDHP